MKIYESKTQIVYRGFDENVVDAHISNPNPTKVLCIYDTKENWLKQKWKNDSPYLALYECIDNMSDAFIIERHKKLDIISKPWQPVAGIKQGIIK